MRSLVLSEAERVNLERKSRNVGFMDGRTKSASESVVADPKLPKHFKRITRRTGPESDLYA